MKYQATKINETEYEITHIKTMKDIKDKDVEVVLGKTKETLEKVESTIEAMENELKAMNEKYKEDIDNLCKVVNAIKGN